MYLEKEEEQCHKQSSSEEHHAELTSVCVCVCLCACLYACCTSAWVLQRGQKTIKLIWDYYRSKKENKCQRHSHRTCSKKNSKNWWGSISSFSHSSRNSCPTLQYRECRLFVWLICVKCGCFWFLDTQDGGTSHVLTFQVTWNIAIQVFFEAQPQTCCWLETQCLVSLISKEYTDAKAINRQTNKLRRIEWEHNQMQIQK